MSVFLNKEKNELILTCGCNCDEALHIKIDVDETEKEKTFYYISYMNSNFDRDQFGSWGIFKKKIKKIWAIIRNKDIYYSDIIMSQEEFNVFKKYINDIDQKTIMSKIKNMVNKNKILGGNGKIRTYINKIGKIKNDK
jgi:hypothetical protein